MNLSTSADRRRDVRQGFTACAEGAEAFTTDSLDRPGIFGLDIARGRLAMLTEAELPVLGGQWSAFDLRRDAQSGMYLAAGPVAFPDNYGEVTAGELD